jgi:gluconate 2-dehydrogenase subunit 3-like protein
VPKYQLPFVTRRELLVWIGATSATSALTSIGCSSSVPPPTPLPATNPFLSEPERAVLGALADAVLPPDDAPGGNALGAVDYIEKLLTAFSEETPLVYAGGPYSGRTPLPNDDGGASSTSPPDEFSIFLPLDRVAERAWRLRIFGSSGVPGGGPNDAILGPVVGLREAVERAIAQAQAAAPPNVAFGDLTAEQRASLLFALDKETQSTLIELILEGSFTAPEYGGNAGLAGWKMTYFEGDSMPYGYSTYDTTTGKYVEHPEAPCSTPNPGPDPMPMDAATEQLVSSTFLLLGGKVFG